MINHPELKEYADLLHANGFTIRASGRGFDYFTYSRVVDGVELFGNVQVGYFGGFSHHMPIRPSREHGSSMWVTGVPDTTIDNHSGDNAGRRGDPLTVEAAQKITSPTNYNPLVGTQRNYRPWSADAPVYVPDADLVAGDLVASNPAMLADALENTAALNEDNV